MRKNNGLTALFLRNFFSIIEIQARSVIANNTQQMKKLLTIILLLYSTVVCAQTEEDYIKVTDYFAVARLSLEHLDVNKTESFINSLPQPFPEDKYAEQCLLHYLKGIIELVKYNNIYEARKNFERYLDLYYRCGYNEGMLGLRYIQEMRVLTDIFMAHNDIMEAIMYATRAIMVYDQSGWAIDVDSTYIKEISYITRVMSQLYATMQSNTEGAISNEWGANSQHYATFSQNILSANVSLKSDEFKAISEAIGPDKSYTAPSYLDINKDSLPFTYDEVNRADKLLKEINEYVQSYRLQGNISENGTFINTIYNKALEASKLYELMLPYRYNEFYTVLACLFEASATNGKIVETYALFESWEKNYLWPEETEAMNLYSYRYFLSDFINTLISIGVYEGACNVCRTYLWVCEEMCDFSDQYLFQSYNYYKLSNINNRINYSILCLTLNDLAYWHNCNVTFNSIITQEQNNYSLVGLPLPDYITSAPMPSFHGDNLLAQEQNKMLRLAQSAMENIYRNEYKEAQKNLEEILENKIYELYAFDTRVRFMAFLALLQFINKDEKYINTSNEAYTATCNFIKEAFLSLPAVERGKIYDKYKFVFDVNNLILWESKSSEATQGLYNSALFTKGLQLRTSTLIQDAILSSGDADVINQYNEINHLYQIFHTLDDSVKEATNLWRMELDLLQKVPFDKTFDKKIQKKWSEVKNSLKKDEAAIEFMRITHWENFEDTADVLIDYCALLLRNNSKSPELIYLCSEDSLQSLLDRGKMKSDEIYYNNIYSNRKLRNCRGDELYNTLWTPIEKHLQGVSTIYYSTDGVLHSLAIHALHDTTNTCISDKYTMNLLSSTGDIQEFKSRKSRTYASAVVYGGAHFSVENSDELIAATEKYNIKQQDNELYAGLQRSGSESDGSWPYLRGTLVEAEYVKAKMDSINVPTRLLTGVEANEESFKAMDRNSPQLLHVATHGFYFSSQESYEISNFMDFLSNAQNLDSVAEAQNKNDAMLRAGLILAGGNRAWSNKEAIEGVEDGILTGREISNLNLSNTKLLVLAACQSGLGETNDHEGVFGLQRAFKLAGVETIIMTLWRIPDATTAELIRLFYDNWTAGMEKHAAFKKAQKQIREQYHNPYFWAGFVILD